MLVQGAVDELDFGVFDVVGFGDLLEGGVVDADASDARGGEAGDVEDAGGVVDGNVVHDDVARDGLPGAVGTLLIKKIDLQHGIGHLADMHVAHENVALGATAHGVGF